MAIDMDRIEALGTYATSTEEKDAACTGEGGACLICGGDFYGKNGPRCPHDEVQVIAFLRAQNEFAVRVDMDAVIVDVGDTPDGNAAVFFTIPGRDPHLQVVPVFPVSREIAAKLGALLYQNMRLTIGVAKP